ncbi:toxin-antitoxin system YwqK family antitoxin [Deminuibacter soli]|uniref:Uncharacterized protein n=1 Tax=Deminuibacter soli TaxID=2291815 RepID=A0A3E1NMD1_9BACT|nr:hypothetical protein [Deminuibacter soli]RFM29095.1 hypothetical protein DXN05_10090 [Deminuibacter soli]
MTRWFLLLCGLILVSAATAQCRTFRIGVKGDTLDCVDMKGDKQGKWVIHVDELRGNPGYEEEGIFKNGQKEGMWRKFNLMGDLLCIENYHWGNKDGISRYYNLVGQLTREESWKATNPDHPYDTVEVPDPVNPLKVTMTLVKVEAHTEAHGQWNYYDPNSGMIVKTETYFLGKLQTPGNGNNVVNTIRVGPKVPGPGDKPREVLEYEKRNSGKKKVREREGGTGY